MCAFPCFLQDLQKMLVLVCFEGYNWEILISPLSQKKFFIISFEDLLSDLASSAKSYFCTHLHVTQAQLPLKHLKEKCNFSAVTLLWEVC